MLNKTILTLRSVVIAAGAVAASSFVGVYGVYLGSTAIDMGWLQSAASALGNGGQLLWGRISDKIGARRPFLVLGSLILAFLWYFLGIVKTPFDLIVVYGLVSFFSAMITVNWFSLIADETQSSVRGRFLALINNISSVGTLVSLLVMTFFFSGHVDSDISIAFFAAAGSYGISAVLMARIRETRHSTKVVGSFLKTVKNIRKDKLFFRYFVAMNTQGFFWSLAWPMFPITMVLVMNFNLSDVAFLTVAAIGSTIVVQFVLGKVTDSIQRPPLIFLNRVLLSGIPLFYAFSRTFPEFVILEIYSGVVGGIQNIVMNSYVLDIVPEKQRAEYLSIINGFNGIVYLAGALTGGYLLSYLMTGLPLYQALIYGYLIVFTGRLLSSMLFLRLKEPDVRGRAPLHLYTMLFRLKPPGSPSGATIRFK